MPASAQEVDEQAELLNTVCASQAVIGRMMLEESESRDVRLASTENFTKLSQFSLDVVKLAYPQESASFLAETANTVAHQVLTVFSAVQPHMSADLAGKYYQYMCATGKTHEGTLMMAKYLSPAFGNNCENKTFQQTIDCLEAVSAKASQLLDEGAKQHGIYDEYIEAVCKKNPDAAECG